MTSSLIPSVERLRKCPFAIWRGLVTGPLHLVASLASFCKVSTSGVGRKGSAKSITDELLTNAERYAEEFERGDLPLPPAKHVVVLACMDARLNPYGLLGLGEGDAYVIRNAGGVVTD